MTRPTLEDVRALDSRRVRITVPKPRENQRLVGVVEADGEGVRLRVEGDGPAAEGHGTVVLRERDGDGVLRAYRGADEGLLVGRVDRVTPLEE